MKKRYVLTTWFFLILLMSSSYSDPIIESNSPKTPSNTKEFYDLLDKHKEWENCSIMPLTHILRTINKDIIEKIKKILRDDRRLKLSKDTKFQHFDFKNYSLYYAIMDGVTITHSTFPKNMDHISCRNSTLDSSSFINTHMNHADLSGATISSSTFINASLASSILQPLYDNDLNPIQVAVLSNSNFHNAIAINADFYYATLNNCNFFNSNLVQAKFIKADLSDADFSESDLESADLSGSLIIGTILTNAKLKNTNLSNAIFEPSAYPNIYDIAFARNLDELRYKDNPKPIKELIVGFKKGGFYKQARQVNAAFRRQLSQKNPFHRFFEKIFFDWPCEYGSNLYRLSIWIFSLWIIGILFYFTILLRENGKSKIYFILQKSQNDGDDPNDHVVALNNENNNATSKKKYKEKPKRFKSIRINQFYLQCKKRIVEIHESWRKFNAKFPVINTKPYLELFFHAVAISSLNMLQLSFNNMNASSAIPNLIPFKYEFKGKLVHIVRVGQCLVSVYLVFLLLACLFINPFE